MTHSESFWDEEESEETRIQESFHERLMLVPKTIEELEMEVLQTKEQLDYLEILRAREHQKLMKVYREYNRYFDPEQFPEYENLLKASEEHVIDVASIYENQVLKITFDFLLPVYLKNNNTKLAYYLALQDIYQKELILKLNESKRLLPNFTSTEKVFVLIVQYFSSNLISDLDNRFHSFIFNALRSAQITPDDRWQKLSYMEEGRKTEKKPYTEIFVGDYKMVSDIISLSY